MPPLQHQLVSRLLCGQAKRLATPAPSLPAPSAQASRGSPTASANGKASFQVLLSPRGMGRLERWQLPRVCARQSVF